MKNFLYIKPSNLTDVFSALAEYDDAFLLAGGTDLLVGMKNDLLAPKCIIDIKGIPNLDSFEYRKGWRFGALTTVRDIETSEEIRTQLPYLAQAAASLASVQIRTRATLGGNICNASPCADMATMFLAMNAQLKIDTPNGSKRVEFENFFTGPKQTVLGRGDLVTEIIVPDGIDAFKGTYLKFGRRNAFDIGIVSAAILINTDSRTGSCREIRIALASVAPVPMRARKSEKFLEGKILTPDLIQEAAEMASAETNPITDVRTSADYRKGLVKAFVKKGINAILEL